MSDNTPQIKIQELYVKDVFPEDFFIKLKSFIFDEPFLEFFKRRINQKRDYRSFSGIWIDDEYFDENSRLACEYPITYEVFIDMYNNIGVCQKTIDILLFHIKLCYHFLFIKGIKSKYCKIKFDKKIINEFYDNDILNNLCNSKISKLSKLYIYKQTHFYMDKSSYINCNLFIKYFICSLFCYINQYLITVIENICPDVYSTLKAYLLEASVNCIKKYNMSKEEVKYSADLITEAKRIKNERLSFKKGAKKKVITGSYFPNTKQELEFEIKKIKKQYELLYSEAKNIIDEMISNPSKTNKLKEELNEIVDFDEYDIETKMTLNNLIYFRQQGETESIKYIILYSLLELSGDLEIFENSNENGSILERIRKYFERIEDNIKPDYIRNNIEFYNNRQFKDLYKKFLNVY